MDWSTITTALPLQRNPFPWGRMLPQYACNVANTAPYKLICATAIAPAHGGLPLKSRFEKCAKGETCFDGVCGADQP